MIRCDKNFEFSYYKMTPAAIKDNDGMDNIVIRNLEDDRFRLSMDQIVLDRLINKMDGLTFPSERNMLLRHVHTRKYQHVNSEHFFRNQTFFLDIMRYGLLDIYARNDAHLDNGECVSGFMCADPIVGCISLHDAQVKNFIKSAKSVLSVVHCTTTISN